MSRSVLRLAALAAVLAAAVLAPAAPASAAIGPCPGENLMPDAANVVEVRRATLCLLNRERAGHRLRALVANRALQDVGQAYAEEMVRERFFAHVSPAGTTPVSRIRDHTDYLLGAARWQVGENLAWGSGHLATPRERVESWMLSPPHRHNILDRGYRHVGIGVALGAPVDIGRLPSATYATEFGRTSRQLGSRAGWRASSRSKRCTTTRTSRARCKRSQRRRTTSSTRTSARRS